MERSEGGGQFCGKYREVLRVFGPFTSQQAEKVCSSETPLGIRQRLLLSKEIHELDP